MIDISIIVVNYNTTKYIRKLVSSLHFIEKLSYELIIVDNNSPERDIEELVRDFSEIKFIQLKENYGFGYANNKGYENANGEYILFMNPDTYFCDNSFYTMFNDFKKNKDWGIIGPRVYYDTGKVQETAFRYPNIRYEVYYLLHILVYVVNISKLVRKKIFGDRPYKTDFIFGSFMLIKREVHEAINGFDPDYFLFSEETDYCFRTNKKTNFKVIHYPKARIIHKSGAITKKFPWKRFLLSYNSKLIFANKNYGTFYRFLFRYSIVIIFLILFFNLYLFNDKEKDIKKDVYLSIVKKYHNNEPEYNSVQ